MIVMECFFRSKPFGDNGKPIRGYRQQIIEEWKEHEVFEITKQQLTKQELLGKTVGSLILSLKIFAG